MYQYSYSMYQVGDRIVTYDGDIGTIKYVGELPKSLWKNGEAALGIEWDDTNRGKHDGTIDGVRYFETVAGESGSFIKANSKKINRERYDFWDALEEKYGQTHSFEDVKIGTKTIWASGFDKLNEKQSHFDQLNTISLGRKNVFTASNPKRTRKHAFTPLTGLRHLDLSFNLFSSLNEIWQILEHSPSLESLDLTGNRFVISDPPRKGLNTTLKELKLSSTNVNPRVIFETVLPSFPKLQRLILAGNYYKDYNLENIELSGISLDLLDLSFNELKSIPSFIATSTIKNVSLSNNEIEKIPNVMFPKVGSLDLRYNQLHEWESVDQICKSFHRINELRINGNPIFEDISIEEATLFLVGRLDCQGWKQGNKTDKLVKLNGSFLMDDEITNAELYFISQVRQGKCEYNMTSDRWMSLTKKYNLQNTGRSVSSSRENFLSEKKLVLKIHINDTTIHEIAFLKDNTVLRLKGIISRNTGKLFMDFDVYYYLNDVEKRERIVLDDDSATLCSFGIQNEQSLYIL